MKEADSVVQILNDLLEQRKNRITTVSNKGEGAIRTSGDFVDERDRGNNQTRWLNFCKAARGRIRNYMNEQIQLAGSKVSQEILAKLRTRCEQFRNEVGRN